MPERPSYFPPDNPFRERGIDPRTGKETKSSDVGPFISKYLGQKAGQEVEKLAPGAREKGTDTRDSLFDQKDSSPDAQREALLDQAESYYKQAADILAQDSFLTETYLEVARAAYALNEDPGQYIDVALSQKRLRIPDAISIARTQAEVKIDPELLVGQVVDRLKTEQKDSDLHYVELAQVMALAGDDPGPLLEQARQARRMHEPKNFFMSNPHLRIAKIALEIDQQDFAKEVLEGMQPSNDKIKLMLLMEQYRSDRGEDTDALLNSILKAVQDYSPEGGGGSLEETSYYALQQEKVPIRFAERGRIDEALNMVGNRAPVVLARMARTLAEQGKDVTKVMERYAQYGYQYHRSKEDLADEKLNVAMVRLATNDERSSKAWHEAMDAVYDLPDLEKHEKEKKISYLQRLVKVEHRAGDLLQMEDTLDDYRELTDSFIDGYTRAWHRADLAYLMTQVGQDPSQDLKEALKLGKRDERSNTGLANVIEVMSRISRDLVKKAEQI